MNSPRKSHVPSRPDRALVLRLQLLRAALVAGVILILNQVVDFGTHPGLLLVGGIFGVYFAGRLLLRQAKPARVAFFHAVLMGAGFVLYSVANHAAVRLGSSPAEDFATYRLFDHIGLIAGIYLVAFAFTWWFWKSRHAVTIESLIFGFLAVWLLGTHRNYHLDAPKAVSELAWNFGVETQHFLLGLGTAFTLLIGWYLVLATHRPLFTSAPPVRTYGRTSRTALFLLPLTFFVLLVSYAAYVNSRYSADLSRRSEGVGQNSNEGESPLGFHSAVGKTKQPAALIRMETDFTENPWAPMLYIREGALSEFNGKELVIASREYDTDVPRIAPGQPFISVDQEEDPLRKRITYSVYLLAKHNNAIAIDYPNSIRLMKNPDAQRFQLAYQAISSAPVLKLDSIGGTPVGSSAWDEKIRAHYLRAPGSLHATEHPDVQAAAPEPVLDEAKEDLRYAAFSRELLGSVSDPIQKAIRLSEYLSKESIYTRQPGHTITPDGDPVAPYLFSTEKRGYCVHFAHAAVYLLRLAGVPARIGTGYLTDLSYAKDGHILLHIGDRHAWPEIYIDGYGWIVADISPARAENEQVIIPDEKLLEDLMSKLDPAEQFITPPPEEKADEKSLQEAILDTIARRENLIAFGVTLVLAWILLKLWLRFGYLTARNERRRTKLAYQSFASLLADLGHTREHGETRREFAERVLRARGINSLQLMEANERIIYAAGAADGNAARRALESSIRSFDISQRRWRRFAAFLSPLSLQRWGRW